MNNLDIILITLVLILAAVLISFIFKYRRLKGNGQLSVSKQINEFSTLIIDITRNVMKLNNISQQEFDDDKEFRKVLAEMVTEELNTMITNEDINNKYPFISELTDEEIELLILNIFSLYKKEIGLMEFVTDAAHFVFNDQKREDRLKNIGEGSLLEPLDENSPKQGTVDITSEIMKFNE